MAWFIGLIGLGYIVLGLFWLSATKKTNLALANFIKNTKHQTMGLIALIFGVLFIISATATQAAWFILALGIMACLKGAMFILVPHKKIKEVIDWWFSAPDLVYKGWAVFVLILGIALFYII
ncbi:MAG: hypothetical protein JW869_01025 [Candidatus Omnitrophica bacterium]|nr:hypothetical protein [Candidatus Omnitrophota bacterium]